MSLSNNYPNAIPSLVLDFANTKKLDSRITFSRASTGTHYDGKTVAKAEENLFTYSQEFDNAAWTKTSSAVTANTTVAPDGTTTGDTLTASAATAAPRTAQLTALTAGVHIVSLFAKAGTYNYIQIASNWGGQYFANFDITAGAGVVGTKGTAATSSSIVDVGNGWYRCIVEFPNFDDVQIVIAPSASATYIQTGTYVGTETVILWGAQLEQRSSVTAYTATTTAPITNYIPALQTAASGVARFEHNPVTGESLGLEIEEQRTNIALRSEQFDDAAWTKTECSITANTIIAPDGTLTGDGVVENTANLVRFVTQTTAVSFTSGTAYTYSIYAKQNGRSIFFLYFETAAFPDNGRIAWFDLSNQTTQVQSGVTASITNVGNGWYRCSITATADATTTSKAGIGIASQSMGSTSNYLGNGFSGIYIWGAQLEAGAFATSYIKTEGSQVTRSADSATMTGTNFSSWYRADEGTITATAIKFGASTNRLFAISDNTNNNRIDYVTQTSTSSQPTVVVNGSTSVDLSPGAWVLNSQSKIATSFQVNNFRTSKDGGAVVSDTLSNVPVVDRMYIGAGATGSANLANGFIQRLAFYPKALTNAELIGLSTI